MGGTLLGYSPRKSGVSPSLQEAQRSWREGPVPGRVGSRGEADAPSDREGRPSTAQAYWRYAEPGAGSPTKGWRCVPSPQAPVAKRAAFSAATSDPRAGVGVLVACLCGVLTVRLRARSCACPPRLGSPLSRDETLPGTGPLQRRSNAKVFARRCTRWTSRVCGSGTVFFSHCNMKCIFCQNYPISQLGVGERMSTEELGEQLLGLERKGAHNVNFVTPTPHAR